MAGPTAAESLIKAAAAGEGVRLGGGAGGKRCEEVGGSAQQLPPTQAVRAARAAAAPATGARQPEPEQTRSWGRGEKEGGSFSRLLRRHGDRARGSRHKEHPRAYHASRTLRLGARGRRLPLPGLLAPPPPTCRSPPAPQPTSRRRNEGPDRCLCSQSPCFINLRLKGMSGGDEPGTKTGVGEEDLQD